jgi:ABC-2 type transport system permease protein
MTAHVALFRVPWFSRVYGLGSVYAKALRDSRLSLIILVGLTGGLMLVVGAAIGQDMATPAARQDLVRLVNSMPPILIGLAGNPVNVGTLGGYLSWKYGPFFALIISIWLIMGLSSALATEAQRGSLDFIAATPLGRRRIALEKLSAYLTLLGVVLVILAACTALAGAVFGTIPGDAISSAAAINFALWVGLIGLASGSVAFALAPFVGRGSAAGVAGVLMMAGFLVNGYQPSVPLFRAISGFTWFSWTAGNVPLAGRFDWASLVPVALVAAVLLVVGVEGFARRDLGVTTAIRLPQLPTALLGVRGPASRSFGERLPLAVQWGIGIGLLGLMMGAGARAFADALAAASPGTLSFFHAAFPDYDLTSAGSFLELTFVALGFIIVGFAASTLVAGWGSDETRGRLEMVLATPLARARWLIASGLGLYWSIVVVTALLATGLAIGAVIAGGDVATPVLGSVVVGLYAAALAGIGLAVGGVFGVSIAGEVVAGLVIVTFLIDLVVPALKWPDWVHQLALTSHFGQPMVGTWDPVGIIVSLALAVAGLAIGAWGMARRDVNA